MANANETIIGIVVIARHGDRLGFYQDPTTYTASDTTITPLGDVQENQLGALIRATYIDSSSPLAISGIDPQVNTDQIKVRADAGDEGGVIFDSSVAMVQGLFPPSSASNTTLANGTTVTSPLGGYQYVPIESVELNEDVSLEGHADCNTWNDRVTQIYNSSVFTQKAQEAQAFFNVLKPFVGDRSLDLPNMFNIFDYMNVESIHNATFSKALPATFLPQAQDLANFHEWILFSDPTPKGIGNIDAYTMLPSILGALQDIANGTLKLHYSAISYKPFISLFNLTASPAQDWTTNGIVGYSASVVLEVFNTTGSSSSPGLRMKFKNGTTDDSYHTLTLQNGMDTVDGFVNALQPLAINSTFDWCNACSNQVDRGCSAFFSDNVAQNSHHSGSVSAVAAGFIGAGVTLAVVLGAFGLLIFLGVVGLGARKSMRKKESY